MAEKKVQAKEPYVIPTCRRCEGKPKLEYNMDFRVRIRCTGCGSRTAWAPTRWQAYDDWEDMQC